MLAGLACLLSCATVAAQDSELGALPPLPDLDLGDPDRKLSWREKRQMQKKAEETRYEDNVYTRTSEDMGRATLGERLKASQKTPARTFPTEINVNNSISSNDDAVTASGQRLMPFGEENEYWAGMPDLLDEETLIDLPPLPDLRTPDQVTKRERNRNRRVAKYEARQAETEAKREEAELRKKATVRRPGADPSEALVLVESQGMNGAPYVGNEAAPETVNSQGTLKPFNQKSEYYQDNQLVYRGDKRDNPVNLWWKRGTSEQGGQSGDDSLRAKFSWANPFRESSDDVQPVSFTSPDAVGGHSASTATLDATPLTSNLRGIKVVGSTRDVSNPVGGISGVQSDSVELPPKVRSVFESRIGDSMTLGDLSQMVRDAVMAYRRSDLPVVDVLVPEQEVTSGVLQLVIIEGRLGDVLVEGAGKFESRALASQIRTERGDVIRESDLSEDLAWINKHPSRQVDLIFSPGSGYGETDIILRSETYREIQAYIAYENSGTSTLGESRALFGTSWTGPLFFGLDSILSYQFTTNFDNSDSDLFGHSGVFAQYLPWRHQVTLLGAYVDSSASITPAGGGAPLETGGVNKQGSGRYGIPLPNIGRLTHELELGMDFKSSNSALAFGNVQVFDTTTEIVQYSLGYNIIAPGQTGLWRMDLEVVSSPGDATSRNRDALFASQRAGASANYTYGRVLIERDQRLPRDWSLYAKIQGQASNRNLLASETLGAGGFDTVRGFEQRVVRGDSGVVGTIELRTPTIYPSTLAGFNEINDGAIGVLFYDAGSLSSKDPLPGEQTRNVGSVGVGFRYQKDDWFTLRVDYGFQVTEDGVQDGASGRWHVGARATF